MMVSGLSRYPLPVPHGNANSTRHYRRYSTMKKQDIFGGIAILILSIAIHGLIFYSLITGYGF